MDTARQVVRWAIPGWALFIFFFMFVVARWVFTGNTITLYNLVARDLLPSITPSIAFVLGGAGIPFGFLIYHFYFWGFWRVWSVPFVPGYAVSLDRGMEILKDLPVLDDLYQETGRQLKTTPETENWTPPVFNFPLFRFRPFRYLKTWVRIIPKKTKEGELLNRRQFELDCQDNWALAGFAWYRAMQALHPFSVIEERLTNLFDVFHSVGAARAALLWAFPLYVGYDLIMHFDQLAKGFWLNYFPYCWPIVPNSLLFWTWYKLLTSARHRTLYQIIKFMRDWIRYTYQKSTKSNRCILPRRLVDLLKKRAGALFQQQSFGCVDSDDPI